MVKIKKDHPALSGHFPGDPVVPGVVILEKVLETICQVEPMMITLLGAPSVKFHAPLRPEEEMNIQLEPYQPQGRKFVCTTGTRLIASGLFTYRRVEQSAGNPE
ncbi:MAG: hypothetical protein JSU59_04660 [Nitrospirota bacterium]|nr:MAG: hypothetical protein JSU59_04660 [Nitrospirota bacterium]